MNLIRSITIHAAALVAALVCSPHQASAATKLNNASAKWVYDYTSEPTGDYRKYFYLDIPAGSPMVVFKLTKTDFWEKNADLYLRRGSLPTPSSYHHRSLKDGTDTITINNPTGARWYVMVRATQPYVHYSLKGTFTPPPPPPPPPPQVWTFNMPFTSTGSSRGYYVDVPAGKTQLKFETIPTISGFVGDAALLYKFGSEPTGASNAPGELLQNVAGSSNEWISITNPSAGRHYIVVVAAYSFNNLSLKITLR